MATPSSASTQSGASPPAPPKPRQSAMMLLAWIAAIKATGISLSSVAIVTATQSLDLSPTVRAIAASATSLAIAATAVAAGVAADRLGRRRVLMWSFVIAGGASVLAALAPSPPIYIAALALCGVGYSIMFTGSYAYMKSVAPGNRLGWALGLVGLYTSVLASAASISGAVLGDANWRLLFLVVPVMCAVAFVLVPRILQPMPTVGSGPVDALGLVLLGVGLVLVISGLTQVAGRVDPSDLALLGVGALLLVGWVMRERTSAHPSFPLGIFRSGRFVGAALVGIAVNIVTVSATLGLTDMWQYIAGRSVLGVTMGLQPLFLIGTIGGVIAGHRLSAGVAPRKIIVVSMALSVVGFLALLPVSGSSDYWLFTPAITLIGMGMAGAMTAQSQVILHAAPPQDFGAVTASKTSIGQLGSALGMVFAVMFVDRSFDAGLLAHLQGQGESGSALQESITTVDSYIRSGRDPGTDALAFTDAVAALGASVHSLALVSAVVLTVTAAATWRLMRDETAPAGVAAT